MVHWAGGVLFEGRHGASARSIHVTQGWGPGGWVTLGKLNDQQSMYI